jgi:hypothetical protein
MHSKYEAYYRWFEERPYYKFPDTLLTFEKFKEFDSNYKGDKSDTRAYNLALCYGADAYKPLVENKV